MTTSDAPSVHNRAAGGQKSKQAIVPRSPRYMRLALLTEYIPRAQKFLRAHIAIGEKETRANVLVTFALGEYARPRVLDFG